MNYLIDILKVIHILTAVLMAWPYYALVLVNQRARLGAPLGDRADIYMENIIRNRTIPCFVFQVTALVTGLALVQMRWGLGVLLTNPILFAKFSLLIFIMLLLLFVHFVLQPKIDNLFAQQKGNFPIPPDIASQIITFRIRRKRMASVCMFTVLVIVMLGSQVYTVIPDWLNAVLVLCIAAFTWRTYKSTTSLGWL